MYKARSAVTVSTTAVRLWQTVTGNAGTTNEPALDLAQGIVRAGSFNDPVPIIVANDGTSTVYLGTAAVTAAKGFPLPKGASLAFSVIGTDAMYAIAASGTVNVRVCFGRQ